MNPRRRALIRVAVNDHYPDLKSHWVNILIPREQDDLDGTPEIYVQHKPEWLRIQFPLIDMPEIQIKPEKGDAKLEDADIFGWDLTSFWELNEGVKN